MMATPHDGPRHPSNTADALFVRANLAVTDLSPAAGAPSNDIARLKLWANVDLWRTAGGGEETAGVLEAHPAPTIATSVSSPSHFRDLPLPDGAEAAGGARNEFTSG
jgi:hypothetical protein